MRRTATLSILATAALQVACGGSAPAPPTAAPPATRADFPADQSGPDWPGWGGPTGDFKVEAAGLADSWGPVGPPVIWSRPLGPGYATIAAAGGALVTAYRDGGNDVVIALRADDGQEIWRQSYASPPHPDSDKSFGVGPNATPLVIGDRVVTLGFSGILNGFDLATGEPRFRHDLIADFGGEALDFGYAASPIEHAGKVIVLVGGQHAVVAFDPADGAVAWRSGPGSVSYATPRVIEVDGRAQLVYFSADHVLGLDAANGEPLWQHPCENQYRNNATGVQWGPGNLLWVATQLDGGTRVLRLAATSAEQVWFDNQISIHFWGSLLLEGTVYASIGSNASVLAAIDLATGETLWRERGFTRVNLVHAGDRTILLDEEGGLSMVRLRPDGIEVLSRATIVEGRTWSAPTLLGSKLYMRDEASIRALDLGASPAVPGA